MLTMTILSLSQDNIYLPRLKDITGRLSTNRAKKRKKVSHTRLFARCLCDKCEAMPSAMESMCCREVKAYRALLENLDPPADITCLTLHPGFEASCLNSFVLQIAYMNFRQEHGPLQASRPEYVSS